MIHHSYLNTIALIIVRYPIIIAFNISIATIVQQNEDPNFSRNIRTCLHTDFIDFLALKTVFFYVVFVVCLWH
jgi:hypothetical protein